MRVSDSSVMSSELEIRAMPRRILEGTGDGTGKSVPEAAASSTVPGPADKRLPTGRLLPHHRAAAWRCLCWSVPRSRTIHVGSLYANALAPPAGGPAYGFLVGLVPAPG